MHYIAILCFRESSKASFDVKIFSITDGYVGNASAVLCRTRHSGLKMTFCDLFVPEKYSISKEEIEQKCKESWNGYVGEFNPQH